MLHVFTFFTPKTEVSYEIFLKILKSYFYISGKGEAHCTDDDDVTLETVKPVLG